MTAPICRLVLVANHAVTLEAEFAATLPATEDGVGGMRVVSRPRQMAMTEWDTTPPERATLSLLFDGLPAGRDGVSQAGKVTYLRRHFTDRGGLVQPPPFRVVGAYPLRSTVHWVCDGLTEGGDDAVVRRRDRVPVRTVVTLNLLQFVPGDVVVKNTAARRSRTGGSGSAKAKTYTVRRGDTLSTIAAKQLGDYRQAGELAKLNGIRDPKNLRAGQKLKLPTR